MDQWAGRANEPQIKDATVKRSHYDSNDQLRQHLQIFIDAYSRGRRLKTLRGLTPYEYVARVWTKDPVRFKIDPYRYPSGAKYLV